MSCCLAGCQDRIEDLNLKLKVVLFKLDADSFGSCVPKEPSMHRSAPYNSYEYLEIPTFVSSRVERSFDLTSTYVNDDLIHLYQLCAHLLEEVIVTQRTESRMSESLGNKQRCFMRLHSCCGIGEPDGVITSVRLSWNGYRDINERDGYLIGNVFYQIPGEERAMLRHYLIRIKLRFRCNVP